MEKKSYASFMNFMLSRLTTEKFPALRGKSFRVWADLQKAFDDHFQIRLTEKSLFRELTDLEREPGEDLFNFYNRLVGKCFDYGKFMRTIFADRKEMVRSRIEQAEEYILDTFIRSVGMNFRTSLISRQPLNI